MGMRYAISVPISHSTRCYPPQTAADFVAASGSASAALTAAVLAVAIASAAITVAIVAQAEQAIAGAAIIALQSTSEHF